MEQSAAKKQARYLVITPKAGAERREEAGGQDNPNPNPNSKPNPNPNPNPNPKQVGKSAV